MPNTPSPLNAAQIASLTKTEQICRVALKPAYLAELITPLDPGEVASDDDITADKINALLADCTTVRNFSADALIATTAKEDLTQEEKDTKTALLGLLHKIQAYARKKHNHDNPTTLKDYGIGENIDASRKDLEQWALTIYQKTATDKLSKVKAPQRQALHDALEAYKLSKTTQTGGQSTATQLRDSRDALLDKTVAARMQIQFGAEAEWSYTDPANHAIRTEFQLPNTRPFVG